MKGNHLSLFLVLLTVVIHVNGQEQPSPCESMCGGRCTYSASDCKDGEQLTQDKLCRCNKAGDVCCTKTPPCAYKCRGHCEVSASLCNYTVHEEYYHYGTTNSDVCDCNQQTDVCCTNACNMEPLCLDNCTTSNNGKCEDGGINSEGDTCAHGSDCTDCGARKSKCETTYNGICRNNQSGCFDNEFSRNEPDLCIGRGDCICCKPRIPGLGRESGGGQGKEDPTFITLDGNRFHFDGKCTYTLLRDCEIPGQEPWFTIYIEHTHETVIDSQGRSKTYVRGVIAEIDRPIGGKHVIHVTKHGLIKINDAPEIDMDAFRGWEDPSMNLRVEIQKQRVHIIMEDYFDVSSNRQENAFVKLGSKLEGKVCGLLGNGDGNPDNDFQVLDRTEPSGIKTIFNPTAKQIAEIGDSWVKPGTCP